ARAWSSATPGTVPGGGGPASSRPPRPPEPRVPAATVSHHIPVLHAIVLGVTQGLSEFLPISSSGHLILVPWLFRWHELAGASNVQLNKTFDVALHMGTFVGAVAYFRVELVRLLGAG